MSKNGHKVRIGKLSEFRPQSQNANKHTERGLRMLDDAMSEDGYVAPATAVADGEVIDGSARLERAFDKFKDEAIILEHDGTRPIITVRTDIPNAKTKEAKRIAVRANRIAQVDLEWNPEVLAELTEAKEIEGLFSDKELAEILTQTGVEPKDAEPQIDKAEELRQKWGTETGQLWVIGNHRLLVGDSTNKADVGRLCGSEKVSAVVTDPPYGIDREGIENDNPSGLRALFDGCLSVMPIKDAVIIAFQSPRMFPVWLDAVRTADHKFERMLWMYKSNDVCFTWRGWLTKSECILVSSVGSPKWKVPAEYNHDCYSINWDKTTKVDVEGWHASIKPPLIIKNLIDNTSGTVYDPFIGSGTTMVAAENLNRKCYAMEISPAYCAVVLERMTTAFPHLKIEKVDKAVAA